MSADTRRFSQRIGRFATTMPRAMRGAVEESAFLTKKLVLDKARPRTGGDLRLSGRGKNGAKIGVRYDVKGFHGNPTALVKATGPFHLIERRTRSHLVGGGRGTRRVRNVGFVDKEAVFGRKLMKIGGTYRTGPWMAGGSNGSAPWKQGIRKARPRTQQVFKRAVRAELARTFTGR